MCLLVVVLLVCLSAIDGCVESTFKLDSDSSLPRWFTLPPGLTRRDVSVTLSYYTLGSVKCILKDWKGKELAEVKGKTRTSEPLHLASSRTYYPMYEVVVANGITEVIEHKKPEPVFYVADDPAIREELLGVAANAP
jgi:hypothetical protein